MPELGGKVYIVDDDDSVGRAWARLVKTDGFRPVTMTSGAELLNMNH
jgi:FixJ family two-component response regulator